MSPPVPHSSPELTRYIVGAGEIQNVDAKGPMAWDGGEASAGLTKDILALANTRDGGVIVIGKSEPDPGKFTYDGVTADQAGTFEVTKVGSWVNARCAPPVQIGVYRQEYQGREFVVLTVREFDDVPVICTKTFELPAAGGKPAKCLLVKGSIYVRTANVESAPLSTVEGVRSLIGLATAKRGDQLLALLNSMLKGRPLVPQPSDKEQFEKEYAQVREALEGDLTKALANGAWRFSFHPARHQAERWQEVDHLQALLQQATVRVRDEFPLTRRDVKVREWGLWSARADERFVLTRSGLFAFVKPFEEDRMDAHPRHSSTLTGVAPGQWLDSDNCLATMTEFFAFMARVAEALGPEEEVSYRIDAGPLRDRHLIYHSRYGFHDPTPPSHASAFSRERVMRVESLRADWKDECVRVMRRFFELFEAPPAVMQTLRLRLDKFLQREFEP